MVTAVADLQPATGPDPVDQVAVAGEQPGVDDAGGVVSGQDRGIGIQGDQVGALADRSAIRRR